MSVVRALAVAGLALSLLSANASDGVPLEGQVIRVVTADVRGQQASTILGDQVVLRSAQGDQILSSVVASPIGPGRSAQGPEDHPWAVSFVNPNNGFYELGLFDDRGWVHRSGDYLLRSDDGGQVWVPELNGPPSAGGTQLVTAAGADELWSVSADRLFRSTDAAGSWQEIELPQAARPDGTFSFSSLSRVAVAGQRVLVVRDVGIVDEASFCMDVDQSRLEALTSIDSGSSWTVATVFEGWAGSFLAAAGDQLAISVDPYRTSGPVSSTDGCSIQGTGFIGEIVHVSDDDGVTWREARRCHDLGAGCTSADVTPHGLFLGDLNGNVHRSVDGARTFTSTPLPNALEAGDFAAEYDWVMGVEILDDEFGFAATNGGGAWRTTDAGASWTAELAPQEVQGLAIGSLSVADRNRALAGGPNTVSRRLDIDQ